MWRKITVLPGGEWDTKTGPTGDFSKMKMFGMENKDSNRPKGQRQRSPPSCDKGSVQSTVYKLFFHWVVMAHTFDPRTLLPESGDL